MASTLFPLHGLAGGSLLALQPLVIFSVSFVCAALLVSVWSGSPIVALGV